MKNIRFVLPVFLLTASVCFAEICNDNPLRPSLLPDCPTIADKLYAAFQAAQEFNRQVDKLNAKITEARSRYWKVFPNGPGVAAAEMAFLEALQEKDLYYLLFSLQQGVNGDVVKYANAIQMTADPFGFDPRTPKDLSFPTNVDDGIRPYAFPMFASWVNALRRAEGRTKDGEWAPLDIMAKALQDKSNWRKQYEDARNWAEFMSSGLDVTKYLTPQVYLVNQMEADVSMGLARSKPADLPDPKASSMDLYNLFVKAFGEKEVLAAAASILQTPKNSLGGLAKRAEVSIGGFQSNGSPNPFLMFLTQAVNASPKNYAVALCLDQTSLLGSGATATFYSKEQWAKAVTTYGQLVTRFGEPAVVAAAAKLKDVPKDDRGGPQGDPDSKGPIYWFTALLKDPKMQVPEAYRFLASSYDPRWMGKIVTVRGTVSRVDVEKGSPPYATIHFREAKNDRFTAFTPNSEILDSYGQNFSGLVGKPVELWGQVQDWKEGSGIRFLVTKQLAVLDAGAMANFKESAPDWMKGPLPASNLVDSPKYLAWKKFPVGSKANYENQLLRESKPGTDLYTKTVISRLTLTLKSIDDERAVVAADSVISHMNGPDTRSSNELIFKAKEAPSTPVDDPTRVITRGEETLTINAKKIATTWENNARADDPMTFTKTWTSDEVPGGLVRTQQQTHNEITGQTYRSISRTLYAPIDGVAPLLGEAATPAPPPAGNSAAPNRGITTASPAASPPATGLPATPAPPAGQSALMTHFSAVMTRAAKARASLGQAQRKLAGAPLPDDIRAAQSQLITQQQAVAAAMRTQNNAGAEQNLRAMEDTLAVIEKFIAQ